MERPFNSPKSPYADPDRKKTRGDKFASAFNETTTGQMLLAGLHPSRALAQAVESLANPPEFRYDPETGQQTNTQEVADWALGAASMFTGAPLAMGAKGGGLGMGARRQGNSLRFANDPDAAFASLPPRPVPGGPASFPPAARPPAPELLASSGGAPRFPAPSGPAPYAPSAPPPASPVPALPPREGFRFDARNPGPMPPPRVQPLAKPAPAPVVEPPVDWWSAKAAPESAPAGTLHTNPVRPTGGAVNNAASPELAAANWRPSQVLPSESVTALPTAASRAARKPAPSVVSGAGRGPVVDTIAPAQRQAQNAGNARTALKLGAGGLAVSGVADFISSPYGRDEPDQSMPQPTQSVAPASNMADWKEQGPPLSGRGGPAPAQGAGAGMRGAGGSGMASRSAQAGAGAAQASAAAPGTPQPKGEGPDSRRVGQDHYDAIMRSQDQGDEYGRVLLGALSEGRKRAYASQQQGGPNFTAVRDPRGNRVFVQTAGGQEFQFDMNDPADQHEFQRMAATVGQSAQDIMAQADQNSGPLMQLMQPMRPPQSGQGQQPGAMSARDFMANPPESPEEADNIIERMFGNEQ